MAGSTMEEWTTIDLGLGDDIANVTKIAAADQGGVGVQRLEEITSALEATAVDALSTPTLGKPAPKLDKKTRALIFDKAKAAAHSIWSGARAGVTRLVGFVTKIVVPAIAGMFRAIGRGSKIFADLCHIAAKQTQFRAEQLVSDFKHKMKLAMVDVVHALKRPLLEVYLILSLPKVERAAARGKELARGALLNSLNKSPYAQKHARDMRWKDAQREKFMRGTGWSGESREHVVSDVHGKIKSAGTSLKQAGAIVVKAPGRAVAVIRNAVNRRGNSPDLVR